MNITEFDKIKYDVQGTGINSKATVDITYKNKETKEVSYVIKAGTPVRIWFSPKKYSQYMFIQTNDRVMISRIDNKAGKFTGINKMPSMKTLEKWSFDGLSKSVTGKLVEPDGYGPDGSPSWLLVVGVI